MVFYWDYIIALSVKATKSHEYFKDRVALAMTLLDDDDAENDWNAWEILTNTLFKAGDFENGAASAGPLFLELLKMWTPKDDMEDSEKSKED